MTTTIRAMTPVRAAPLWRTGGVAGIAAAVVTTVVAVLVKVAGASLEVGGEPIPLLAFAQMTLGATVIGLLLAMALSRWAAAPKRTFFAATFSLTAVSVVPDLLVSATVGTRAALITTHIVAAVIVIPAIAGRLPDRTRPRPATEDVQ